jgi:hypothetical protein
MAMKLVLATAAAVACAQNLRSEEINDPRNDLEELHDPAKDLFVYPEEFGNYTLSSCSSAPACGTAMASYNGVSAKSNGANQCTGNSCGGYGTYGNLNDILYLHNKYNTIVIK